MSYLGLVMAFGGFIYAIVVVLGRLAGLIVTGTSFAALMTVLLVGQGMIMAMLGVLGEYLWRTYDEARGRPWYIVDELQKARTDGDPGRENADGARNENCLRNRLRPSLGKESEA
jgi:dolichol-phosphate mannosyltransferase